LKHLNSGSGW